MPPPESASYLDQFASELSRELGIAIWVFSAIESATFDYLKKLSTEPLHELMANQLFKPRITLVRALVNRIDGFEQEKVKALGYLKHAEELAKTRNAIAHNPWQIWADFESKELKAEIKPRKPKGKMENLDSIKAFIQDAEKVLKGMQSALDSLPFISNDG